MCRITDIDDKMIARASLEGVTVQELSERFIGNTTRRGGAGHPPGQHYPRRRTISADHRSDQKPLAYVLDGDVF